jgi:actin-related protein 10
MRGASVARVMEFTCLFRKHLVYYYSIRPGHLAMSGGHTTPRGKPPLNPTTPTARLVGTHVVQSSPHYATTRRHSLYGTEDRVIIDPGSKIWKVGFSGEGRPRDVFYAAGKAGTSLWDLGRARDTVDRAEQDRLLEVNLEGCLRSVFHQCVGCAHNCGSQAFINV